MRNVLILSLLFFLLTTFSSVGKDYKSTGEKCAKMGKSIEDMVIARVDGEEIHFSKLDYDVQVRYKIEYHELEKKLYREQRSKLDKLIERMLLEKEAARTKTTPDELIVMINSKKDLETTEIKVDKEKFYQDFLDSVKMFYPSFSEMSKEKQLKTLKKGFGIDNSFKGSLEEEIKNKLVGMKKGSTQHSKKSEFLEDLRAKADIEILLKRPELIHLDITPDDDPYLGNKDAKITIIEFSDYQCPFSRKVRPILNDLLAKRGDKIKTVYRDFPLAFHKNAKIAAAAAECADEQGAFWEYNELLFDNQRSLDVENLKKYAKSIGLDAKKFNYCLDSGKQNLEVEKDVADAKKAGISGTPNILINGYCISGVPSLAYLEEVIADVERSHIPRVQEDVGKG